MNVFLFLYPIREYIEEGCRRALSIMGQKGLDTNRLNEIIGTRYRMKSYRIVWLFFGLADNGWSPDLSHRSSHMTVTKFDHCIANGIPFDVHVRDKIYPEPERVLQQFPAVTINRLVIGGFHQWDCVDRMATCAYARDIPVTVDEDTTENFFHQTAAYGDIPLIRPANACVKGALKECGKGSTAIMLRNHIHLRRKGKPWFAQP